MIFLRDGLVSRRLSALGIQQNISLLAFAGVVSNKLTQYTLIAYVE